MGWLPTAIRRDVGAPDNYSNGAMRSHTGIVLHVNDADSGDLYDWITGNHDMSCHFQVTKDGAIFQYIDTRFSSWCQEDGNDDYLSIETSGLPGEPLTDAQLSSCAEILTFVHAEHDIPLLPADSIGATGLAWHGMGGASWGGHTGCPGDLRKAQRAEILARAGKPAPLTGGFLMSLTDAEQAALQHQVGVTDANAKLTVELVTSIVKRVADVQNTLAAQTATLAALKAAIAALDRVPAGVVDLTGVQAKLTALPAELRAELQAHPLALSGAAS